MTGLEQLFAPNSEDPVTFQYVVIHVGCKNRLGVLAAQAVHAGNECLRTKPQGLHDGPVSIVSSKNRVCVLEADSSQILMELSMALAEANVQHCLVIEPDSPWDGAATAVGTEPVPLAEKEKIMKFFSHLKLLKEKK